MMDLVPLFDSFSNEYYCIVKISESFPEYVPGQDVDIFSYEPQLLASKVLEWGNKYAHLGFKIKFFCDDINNHMTVDFMEGKKVHLRFDIYGQMPKYKKLAIKPALFESIVENSIVTECKHNENTFNIKVPSLIDDMILRYLEFIEWYNVRPDKIKHLDNIMEKMNDDLKIKFLDKIHHYTTFPGYTDVKKRNNGLKDFIGRILKKKR